MTERVAIPPNAGDVLPTARNRFATVRRWSDAEFAYVETSGVLDPDEVAAMTAEHAPPLVYVTFRGPYL